jgi:hypothetical protein
VCLCVCLTLVFFFSTYRPTVQKPVVLKIKMYESLNLFSLSFLEHSLYRKIREMQTSDFNEVCISFHEPYFCTKSLFSRQPIKFHLISNRIWTKIKFAQQLLNQTFNIKLHRIYVSCYRDEAWGIRVKTVFALCFHFMNSLQRVLINYIVGPCMQYHRRICMPYAISAKCWMLIQNTESLKARLVHLKMAT